MNSHEEEREKGWIVSKEWFLNGVGVSKIVFLGVLGQLIESGEIDL